MNYMVLITYCLRLLYPMHPASTATRIVVPHATPMMILSTPRRLSSSGVRVGVTKSPLEIDL